MKASEPDERDTKHHLDEDEHVLVVLAVPLVEGVEELEAGRLGVDVDADGGRVGGRRLERVLAGVEAERRQFVGEGVGQEELGAVGGRQLVGARVKVEPAGQRQRRRQLGRRDEAVRRRIGVVARRKVAVVRRHDRVLLALLHVLPVPLADARAARVRQHLHRKGSSSNTSSYRSTHCFVPHQLQLGFLTRFYWFFFLVLLGFT